MIGRLSGTLVEKNPPQILLDVQDVAYEVDVPMSTFYNLPNLGERVTLFTHLVVREDAHLLFGFGSESERRAFRQLIPESRRRGHAGLIQRFLRTRFVRSKNAPAPYSIACPPQAVQSLAAVRVTDRASKRVRRIGRGSDR